MLNRKLINIFTTFVFLQELKYPAYSMDSNL